MDIFLQSIHRVRLPATMTAQLFVVGWVCEVMQISPNADQPKNFLPLIPRELRRSAMLLHLLRDESLKARVVFNVHVVQSNSQLFLQIRQVATKLLNPYEPTKTRAILTLVRQQSHWEDVPETGSEQQARRLKQAARQSEETKREDLPTRRQLSLHHPAPSGKDQNLSPVAAKTWQQWGATSQKA